MVADKVGDHAGPLKPIFTGAGHYAANHPPAFMTRSQSDEKASLGGSTVVDEKSGYGFSMPQTRGMGWGKAGEKFAAAKGERQFFLRIPIRLSRSEFANGFFLLWY